MSLPAISSLSLHPVVPTAAPKKKAKTGSSSGASRRPPPGLNDEHNAEWLKIDQYLDELQNDATPLRERLQTLDSFFDYLVGATEDLTVDDYERRMKCADRQDVIDLLDSISPNVKCEDPAQDDAAKGHVLLMLRFYREVYSDKVGKDGHFEIGPGMLDFCLRTMDNHVDLVAAAQAARILHQLIETAIDKTLVYTNDPTVAPAGLEELVRLYVSEHRLCERIGLQFKAIREQGQERAGLLRNWSLTDGPGAPYMEFVGLMKRFVWLPFSDKALTMDMLRRFGNVEVPAVLVWALSDLAERLSESDEAHHITKTTLAERTILDLLVPLMGLRNPLTNDRLRLNEKNIDQFADAGGIPVVIEACLGDMAFAEDHKWREGTLFSTLSILWMATKTNATNRNRIMSSFNASQLHIKRMWPTPDLVENDVLPYSPTVVPRVLYLLTTPVMNVGAKEGGMLAYLLMSLAKQSAAHEKILVRAITRRIRGFASRSLTSEDLKKQRAGMDVATTTEEERRDLDARIGFAVVHDNQAIINYGAWFYALAQLIDYDEVRPEACAELVANGGETKLLQILTMEAMPLRYRRGPPGTREGAPPQAQYHILRVLRVVARRGGRGLEKLHALNAAEKLANVFPKLRTRQDMRAVCTCFRYLLDSPPRMAVVAREQLFSMGKLTAVLNVATDLKDEEQAYKNNTGEMHAFEVDCTYVLSSIARVLEPNIASRQIDSVAENTCGRLVEFFLRPDVVVVNDPSPSEDAVHSLKLARFEGLACLAQWGGAVVPMLLFEQGVVDVIRSQLVDCAVQFHKPDARERVVSLMIAVLRLLECFARALPSTTLITSNKLASIMAELQRDVFEDARHEYPVLDLAMYKTTLQLLGRPVWKDGTKPVDLSLHRDVQELHDRYWQGTVGKHLALLQPAIDAKAQGASTVASMLTGEVLKAFYQLMDFRWLFYDPYNADRPTYHLDVIRLCPPSLFVSLLHFGTEVQKYNSLKAMTRLLRFDEFPIQDLFDWSVAVKVFSRQALHIGPASQMTWGATEMRDDKQRALSAILVAYSTSERGRRVLFRNTTGVQLLHALYNLSPELDIPSLRLRRWDMFTHTTRLMLARLVEAVHNTIKAGDIGEMWARDLDFAPFVTQEALSRTDLNQPQQIFPKLVECAGMALYSRNNFSEPPVVLETASRVVDILEAVVKLYPVRSEDGVTYYNACIVHGFRALMEAVEYGVRTEDVLKLLARVAGSGGRTDFCDVSMPAELLEFPMRCFTLAETKDQPDRYKGLFAEASKDMATQRRYGNAAGAFISTIFERLLIGMNDYGDRDAQRSAKTHGRLLIQYVVANALPQACVSVLETHTHTTNERRSAAVQLLSAMLNVAFAATELSIFQGFANAVLSPMQVLADVDTLWKTVLDETLNWGVRQKTCVLLRRVSQRVAASEVRVAALGNMAAYATYLELRALISARACEGLAMYAGQPVLMYEAIDTVPLLYDVLVENFVDNTMCADVWTPEVMATLRALLQEFEVMKLAALSYKGASSRAGQDLVAFMLRDSVELMRPMQNHIHEFALWTNEALATHEGGPLALIYTEKATAVAEAVVKEHGLEERRVDEIAERARDTALAIVNGSKRMDEYLQTLDQLEKLGGPEWDMGTPGDAFWWASPGHQSALLLRRVINEDPYSPHWVSTQIRLALSTLYRVDGTASREERIAAFKNIFTQEGRSDSILNFNALGGATQGPAYLSQMVNQQPGA